MVVPEINSEDEPGPSELEQKKDQKGKEETAHADESSVQFLRPYQPQARATDILCHANVLCARSPYFESCLDGEWSEAKIKTVEIVLANDQAVQNMKLLIKLSYSGSYIYDEEELLD